MYKQIVFTLYIQKHHKVCVFQWQCPQPLPGGEHTSGAASAVPLLGGARGGFTQQSHNHRTLDPQGRTAVILVNGFNGLGLHTLFAVVRMFPKFYQNFVFAQVGVIDAGNFKGATEVENLKRHVAAEGERYAAYMRSRGFAAEARQVIGTDVVEEATGLCAEITKQFPNFQIFAGQLVFPSDSFLTRLLHNYTVFALQRRFYREGWPMLILPIRV